MPKIKVHKKHNKNADQTRELAEQLAQSLQQKYQMDYQWQGDTLNFKRQGISGDLELHPGEIRIVLKTGIMMTAFTGTIETELNKALDKYLA